MGVTLKDVAEKAGVSKSTVSFVLNKKPYVSQKLRQHVMDVIEELDYHPNELASKLGKRQFENTSTQSICFISCGIDLADISRNPYYSEILTGATMAAQANDYRMIYMHTERGRSEFPAGVDKSNTDGIIFTCRPSLEYIKYAMKREIPFVLADFDFPEIECDSVMPDNFKGIFETVGYLYKLGHKNIAFACGDLEHPDSVEKLRGYKMAMQEFGLSHESKIIISTYSPEAGKRAIEELYKRKTSFTALIAGSDQIAVGIYDKAFAMGLKIPDDLSVTGFDDIEISRYMKPALSTVYVDLKGIGKKAVERLFQVIEKRDTYSKVKVMTKFIARESCKKLKAKG
ncbi:MAG: hypothetical protein A2017_17855 [Lentisphaerae bacterium GWF2_44_16]|nr:MAG: hypothetical protein A2017_17855 [Lentisphaerae bacterium GWF2_44_16]